MTNDTNTKGRLSEYRDDIRNAIDVMNKGELYSTPLTRFGELVVTRLTPMLFDVSLKLSNATMPKRSLL